jgi:transitional endoplasmic reticulum ATPase
MLAKYQVQPKITFADLGGVSSAIKQLQEMIDWPLKYSNIFGYLGVKPPKGILISGPPGTGKTSLALAVAG